MLLRCEQEDSLKSFSFAQAQTQGTPLGNGPTQTVLDLPHADILIIEDESLMSALMQRYLKTLSFSDFSGHRKNSGPIKVLNLESGWELLNSDLSHVKVAIIDILLPQVTGVDLVRDFRRRYPNMGLLPVSGMATEPMKRSLKELLPEGFQLLNKPLRREDFIENFLRAWNFSREGNHSKTRKPEKQPIVLIPKDGEIDPQGVNAIGNSYWSAGVSSSNPVSVVKRKNILKKAA